MQVRVGEIVRRRVEIDDALPCKKVSTEEEGSLCVKAMMHARSAPALSPPTALEGWIRSPFSGV